MATTIKVECQGPTGTTTATAAKRAIDATASGVLTSVTVTEDANHDGLFVATLTYDESDPANEPLGDWAVTVGGVINTVTMTEADNLVGYKAGLPNVSSAEIDSSELASELATILAGTTIYVDSPIFSGADNENLEVEQGDEYSENPTRITINSATDFVGKKLVLAARLATLTSTKMALSMTIKLDGVSGDQYAEFAPTAAITELWTPGTYELRHRIELAPNKFRTLKRGTLTVRPFDTPSPIVDVDPPA